MKRGSSILVVGGALAALFAGALVLDGCGDPTAENGQTARIQSHLFSTGTCHPGQKRLRTCWDPVTFGNATDAEWERMHQIRERVRDEIGRKADVDFTGWDWCGGGEDVWLGRTDGGTMGGCGIWVGPDMVDDPSETWARGVTLHEFMHVLGFTHEVDRADQPASDQDPVNGPPGRCGWQGLGYSGTFYTPYDPLSIMNYSYCGAAMSVLSPWDVVGLQKAFGRKLRGSTVTQHNQCMSVSNPRTPSAPPAGSPIQTADCALQSADQLWTVGAVGADLSPFYLSYYAPFGGGAAYLDVPYGNSADGTQLWNWTGNGTDPQMWRFQSQQIVGMGDLCLEVSGAGASAGATVQLNTCDPSSAVQRWTLKAGDGTHIAQGSYCLSRSGGLTMQRCAAVGSTAGASQDWQLFDNQIYNTAPSKACVDVSYANPVVGNAVGLAGCRTGTDDLRFAQYWRLRGAVRGLANKCVDADNSNRGPMQGSPVQLWTCNGWANQSWEHWF